jgi:catechol 2,3-dioxygenase-like lactoylglutathione lyase family enzyme
MHTGSGEHSTRARYRPAVSSKRCVTPNARSVRFYTQSKQLQVAALLILDQAIVSAQLKHMRSNLVVVRSRRKDDWLAGKRADQFERCAVAEFVADENKVETAYCERGLGLRYVAGDRYPVRQLGPGDGAGQRDLIRRLVFYQQNIKGSWQPVIRHAGAVHVRSRSAHCARSKRVGGCEKPSPSRVVAAPHPLRLQACAVLLRPTRFSCATWPARETASAALKRRTDRQLRRDDDQRLRQMQYSALSMEMAKKQIDVGLYTNQTDAMLAFWQTEVGLRLEEMLPLGQGVRQYRHAMNGSVLKLNTVRDAMPHAAPGGYRELWIASTDVVDACPLMDCDGNVIRLVPSGYSGVNGIALKLAVSSAERFRDFYGRVMRLPPATTNTYRCGDSLLCFAQDESVARDQPMRGPGLRYFTIQVVDVDREHATLLERGATEGLAPVTLGQTARISFIRDPDGNWIELSQRASLTGSL